MSSTASLASSLISYMGPRPNINVTNYDSKIENVDLIGRKALIEGNADIILTLFRTITYAFVDLTGGARQISAALQAITVLAHGSSSLSGIAGAGTPIGLLITGPLCMATAVRWTIPDAYTALKQANEELNSAREIMEEPQKSAAVQEGKKAVQTAKLGLANQGFYLGMGAGQTASGVVAMCSVPAAQLFHYTPVLTGAAAGTAAMVTGIGLGVIYTVRGALILIRAIKSYCQVHDFHQVLKSQNDIDQAVQFLQEEEKRGEAYLKRRINASCLMDQEGHQYTASGIQNKDGEIQPYASLGQKIEYLKRVDKGIYTEELKHKISIVIALAMIIGGILAIALSIMLTGGIAAVIIGLASATFFICMEYVYLTYDSSKAMEWLNAILYSEPKWLQNLYLNEIRQQ